MVVNVSCGRSCLCLEFPDRIMTRILSRALLAMLASFFLTQCSGLGGFGGSRENRLVKLGYESVSLQKLPNDVRYSGVFKVNGKKMRFLIDSGANSTDVSERLATSAGLMGDESVKVVTRGALGREISSSRGLGSLQIGQMVADNFPFTIAPSSGRKTSTSSYAGQVGLDALSSTGSLVDIPGAKLWVPNSTDRLGAGADLSPKRGLGQKVLKMGRAGRMPHLILNGSLNGKQVTWVVDTGAEISVMASESFNSFGIPSVESNARMIDASGDRIALRKAQLKNLRFGDVNVSVFDISVAPLSTVRQYFRDQSGRPVDGILGMDFLTNSQALLDSQAGLLYLGLVN